MGDEQPVRVPPELRARPEVLEEYVQARIAQMLRAFTGALQANAPTLAQQTVSKSMQDAFAALPPPEYSTVPLDKRELQLSFSHECMALGCQDAQCALCQHNPSRRCAINFDRKYLVGDQLKARCGASIRVELVDAVTGRVVEEEIPELKLEVCVLDGQMYDSKLLDLSKTQGEGAALSPAELEECALLQNKKKNSPLLVCGAGAVNASDGRVTIPVPAGSGNCITLPELHISDSSEAILLGRKPPFRLLVKPLLPPEHMQVSIRQVVSDGFVVATRRTRTAGKVEIPCIDDPVSKLEHMGKETVKKLQDIYVAGQQVGMDIQIPENCVQKVGDFKTLALRAEQDGHLRQRLQHVLKLSREKWEEARDHAMRAVVADSRMRVWYADRQATEIGLLFACRLGSVELDRPIALVQTRMLEDSRPKTDATLMDDLLPMQREMVAAMHPQAVNGWWQAGHPGWAIFNVDTDHFLQTGSLDAPVPMAMTPRDSAPAGPTMMMMPGLPGPHTMMPHLLTPDGKPAMLVSQAHAAGPGAPRVSNGGGPGWPGAGGMGPPPPPLQRQDSPPNAGVGRPSINPFADVAVAAAAAAAAAGGAPGAGAGTGAGSGAGSGAPIGSLPSPRPLCVEPDPFPPGGRRSRAPSDGGALPGVGGVNPGGPAAAVLVHVKRQLEPMEVPSPSGNHEQQWRGQAPWAPGARGPSSLPQQQQQQAQQQQQQQQQAGSMAARASAAGPSRFSAPPPPPPLGPEPAPLSPGSSPNHNSSPNPFLSVQHQAVGAGVTTAGHALVAPTFLAPPHAQSLPQGLGSPGPGLGRPSLGSLDLDALVDMAAASHLHGLPFALGPLGAPHPHAHGHGHHLHPSTLLSPTGMQQQRGPQHQQHQQHQQQLQQQQQQQQLQAAEVVTRVLDGSRPSSQSNSQSAPGGDDVGSGSDHLLAVTSSDLETLPPVVTDHMDTSFTSLGRCGSLSLLGSAGLPSLLQGGIPSLNAGVLSSLGNLMESGGAVAMEHEGLGFGGGGGLGGGHDAPLRHPAMAMLQRQGSALDRMQSIEQALPGLS